MAYRASVHARHGRPRYLTCDPNLKLREVSNMQRVLKGRDEQKELAVLREFDGFREVAVRDTDRLSAVMTLIQMRRGAPRVHRVRCVCAFAMNDIDTCVLLLLVATLAISCSRYLF